MFEGYQSTGDGWDMFEWWVTDEFTAEELKDIAEYGCEQAGVHEFVFYEAVNRFWNDNIEMMEEASVIFAYELLDMSLVDLIKHLDTNNEEWHNIKQNLLFAMIEHVAIGLGG